MIVCKVRFSLLLLLLQWQWLVARVHSRKECKTICARRCFLAMLLVKSTVYDLNWLTTSVVHCMWEWLTAHTSFLTFPFPLTAGLMGHHRWLHNQFTPFSWVNSTALWDLVNSRPVHFLMLSSHLFLCLPCLLPLSLCIARWFWPDLMNGRHAHTTSVCVSLLWSGGLVIQLPDVQTSVNLKSCFWAVSVL